MKEAIEALRNRRVALVILAKFLGDDEKDA